MLHRPDSVLLNGKSFERARLEPRRLTPQKLGALAPEALSAEAVDLGSHNEIALSKAIDLMRP